MRIGVYLGRHAGHGGGIGVYARGLTHALITLLEEADRRTEEVVLYGDRSILDDELLNALKISPVRARIRVRNLPSVPGIAGIDSIARKLNTVLDQITVPLFSLFDRIDILHSVANIGLAFSRRTQIVTVHDLYQAWSPVEEGNAPTRLTNLFYRALFRRQFAVASQVITDAKHVATEIASRYRVGTERISTIPLGLDPEFLDVFAEHSNESLVRLVADWRSAHKLPSRAVLLLASSDPRKNLSRALEAWSQLPEELRSVPLVVKALDQSAEQQISALRAEGANIIALPWTSRGELIATYLCTDTLLSPTLAEGFGFPALEALVCGCRVVSGPIEFLDGHSLKGLYTCNPRSTESIAENLRAALSENNPQEALLNRIELVKSPRNGRDQRLQRTLLETCRETSRVYSDVALRQGIR